MKRRGNSDNVSSSIDDLLDQVTKENSRPSVQLHRQPEQPAQRAPQQMYAIFREKVRVSDSEYPGKFEATSSSEYQHWNGILTKFPDGSRLEILPIYVARA